jgi:hypothetical protein
MSKREHPSSFCQTKVVFVQYFPAHEGAQNNLEEHDRLYFRTQQQGEENMLGIIAAVLIVLWLFGFFAFHVTTSFIHIALVVGLILLLLHFVRGSAASV